MGITAVIGLQWGDEGKGKVVDAFCQHADVAVRCQGGANAGHTVVVEGKQFVLHLIPAGILTEGISCVIGSGVAVDLGVLEEEIREIGEAGIETSGRLMLSTKAHVVLPLHKKLEAVQEESRGAHRLDTTGRGIGPCYSDRHARLGVRVGDLLERETLTRRVRTLWEAYRSAHQGEQVSSVDENLEHCMLHAEMVKELAGDAEGFVRKSVSRDEEVVLEGSQGFLLDIDHGTYPFVTSCGTGIHGIAAGAGLAPGLIERVVGVVKAYMTRVGAGLLPTQMAEPLQSLVRERGKEYGATTGRARRCGWLDLTAVRYSCALNGVTSIAVTKLDTLAGLEELRLCEAYDYKGTCLQSFPADLNILEACTPRYSEHPTWEAIQDVTCVEDLPRSASSYVGRILEAASADLELISLGPRREQLVRVES
jgi:adenylosuccinate synthase